MPAGAQDKSWNGRVALALAGRAYADGTFRLVDGALAGFTHLVATRRGLFAIDERRFKLVAHGMFYGMTVARDAVYVFEACGLPRVRSQHGRIVRLTRDGDTLSDPQIIARDLDNGCHQMDFVGPELCLIDTANQRCILLLPDGSGLRIVPLFSPDAAALDYVHANSLLDLGDRIFVIFHNGSLRPERASELAVYDRSWNLIERRALLGEWCHSLALLEDGTILICGTRSGELITLDGLRLPVSDMLTRGLSVGRDRIAVGLSAYAGPDQRAAAAGAVLFLDRDYREVVRVDLPGAPTEIRSLMGPDVRRC